MLMTDIDIVITELEIVVGHHDSEHMGKVSFIFLDQTPDFPKVDSLLRQIEEQPDAYVVRHSISTTDIDEKSNLSVLDYTIH